MNTVLDEKKQIDTVTFTRVTNRGSDLTKVFQLGNDGVVHKSSSANITEGVGDIMRMPFSQFTNFLSTISSKQAIIHGTPKASSNAAGLKRFALQSKKKIRNLEGYVTRTKDNFEYPSNKPGLAGIDYDPEPGQTYLSPHELIEVLSSICPEIRDAARVINFSAGSYIYNGDKPVSSKEPGYHIYFRVKEDSDIGGFFDILFKRTILAGYGFIRISKCGAQLVRSLFDQTVYSPERIDYVAPAVCHSPMNQRKPKPEYIDGNALDTLGLQGLSDSEEAQYNEIVAKLKSDAMPKSAEVEAKYTDVEARKIVENDPTVSKKQAKQIVAGRMKRELSRKDLLHFDELGKVSVGDVLDDPLKYDNQSLRDPLEPEEGGCKAKFYMNAKTGIPLVRSFLHGGINYELISKKTVEDVCQDVDALHAEQGKDVTVEQWYKIIVEAGLSYVEVDEVLEYLDSLEVGKKQQLKQNFEELGGIPNGELTALKNSELPMPEGFKVLGGWIYYIEYDKKGRIKKKEKVCSQLMVTARSRDSESAAWGKYLEFLDPDKIRHKWSMPSEMLANGGKDLREVLFHLGLEINPTPNAFKYLNVYLSEMNPSKKVLCVDKMGWSGSHYVTQTTTFGPPAAQEIVYQGSMKGNPYERTGTLEEWQSKVARYCVGNSRFVFAVCLAFAGPLLDMTGSESGGFHFYGGSSTGKTTLADVSASVCGNPEGYVRQWRQTDNALESTAELHNDNLLVLDEISQATSKVVAATCYMLANGQGKGRAKRDGVAKDVSRWRLVFISTGEITIEAKIKEGDFRIMGGQSVRLIDIPADTGSGMKTVESLNGCQDAVEFVQDLKLNARRYYGTALHEYLSRLTNDVGPALRSVTDTSDRFIEDNHIAGGDPQVHRVCKRFALIAGAGELATEYGITGWEPGEATKAASACFDAWLDARGGVGSKEAQTGLNQVINYLQQHGASRFDDGSGDRVVIKRAGFLAGNMLATHGDCFFDIFEQVFNEEICEGQDPKTVLAELKAKGFLKTSKGRGYWRRSYPGSNRRNAKFIRINSSIIGGLDQGEGDVSPEIPEVEVEGSPEMPGVEVDGSPEMPEVELPATFFV